MFGNIYLEIWNWRYILVTLHVFVFIIMLLDNNQSLQISVCAMAPMFKLLSRKLLLSLFLICNLSLSFTISADTYPKRELRSVWLTTAWAIDWPTTRTTSGASAQRSELKTLIQGFKAAGFNAVYFQIRSQGDAMYKSSYEAWSSNLTGTRGNAPTDSSWDPLAYCIEQCHANGLECHAWVNPFRILKYDDLHDDEYIKKNKHSDWIITNSDNSQYRLNPGLEEVRDYLVNKVLTEIVTNYNIDGLVFDDYFYPDNIVTTEAAEDYQLWQNAKNSGATTLDIANWRRQNVNTVMQAVYDMVQRIKPSIKFGIGPAGVADVGAVANGLSPASSVIIEGSDRRVTSSGYQYNGIFADPCAWIKGGYLDYISPQLYWPTYHSSAPYEPLCKWWSDLAHQFNIHCYVSSDINSTSEEWTNSTDNYTERNKQLTFNRKYDQNNAPGAVFYSSKNISGPGTTGFGDYLKANLFQNRAVPPMLIKDSEIDNLVDPGKVANLTRSNTTLSWTAKEGFYNMRYGVYAIPKSVSTTDAKSTVHTEDGGFKADYLVDITYSNSYTGVPTGDYYYAVTAIDNYGKEWEAAYIEAPLPDVSGLSLSTPATGSTIDLYSQEFTWVCGGTGGTFTIEISDNTSFIDPIITHTTTTYTTTPEKYSATIDVKSLASGTYYWRVTASQEGHNDVTSAGWSFIVPQRENAPIATLVSPEEGATAGESVQTFTWNGSATSYTLQISASDSFSTIIKEETTTGTSIDVLTSSLLPNKTYYWRVIAHKDGYLDSTSSTASFITEAGAAGNYTVTEQWTYSGSSPTLDGDSRGMTTLNGKVYVINRNDIIWEFSGETGEYLRTINLSGDHSAPSNGSTGSWIYMRGNDIFVDGAGNLCVSNATTRTNESPLTVCTVDLSTGKTTRVFESSLTSTQYRIDYAAAYGNVTAAGGQIWAAYANSNYVLRYTRNANGTWTAEQTTIGTYYPASATNNGTAPRVMPISSTQFILDGGSSAPALYTFNAGGTAIHVDGFDSNTEIAPTDNTYNGMCTATLYENPIFVYVSNKTPNQFTIVNNPDNFNFASMEKMWTIPENGLGTGTNSVASSQPASINNSDGSVNLFLYTPNCGLACYKLSLPQLDAVTLTAPINGIRVEEGFDFSWSAITGAAYTLEVSTSSSFSTVDFTATTTNNSYSSSNFNLAGGTTYYWRINASKSGFTSSTSNVGNFVTARQPYPSPKLGFPLDGTTITEDTPFTATKTSDEQYIEIVTDPANFDKNESDLYLKIQLSETYKPFEDKENVTDEYKNQVWYNFTTQLSFFANGTYYWRSRAIDPSGTLDDGISQIWSFTVTDSYDIDPTYTIKRESTHYNDISLYGQNVSFTNNWIRSSTYSNSLNQTNQGARARGFCVRSDVNGDQGGKDIIYIPSDISGIADDSSDNTQYLERYDAGSGKRIDDLKIEAGKLIGGGYKNIGVFTDAGNNICVYPLVTAAGTLQICTIDPKDGTATERFNVTTSGRSDHCRVVGDITSGNFFVFSIIGTATTTTTVYRWTVENNKVTATESTQITSFYPTSGNQFFGGNSMIFPVDESYYYTDGSYKDFTLYKFGESTPVGSFSQATAAAGSTHVVNGGAFFTHAGQPFIAYPFQGSGSEEYRYRITSVSSHTGSFSGASVKYTIPESGALPAFNNGSGAYCALVDYLPKNGATSRAIGPNSTRLFMYVPGDGLAAYTMTNYIYTGEEEVVERKPEISIVNDIISWGGFVAQEATLYSIAGNFAAYAENSESMDAPMTKGVYILQLNINGAVSTHKIIIK